MCRHIILVQDSLDKDNLFCRCPFCDEEFALENLKFNDNVERHNIKLWGGLNFETKEEILRLRIEAFHIGIKPSKYIKIHEEYLYDISNRIVDEAIIDYEVKIKKLEF